MVFDIFMCPKLPFVELLVSGKRLPQSYALPGPFSPPKPCTIHFFPEAICHDSDTIHMKGDILTNRIVVSVRFIFAVLNTVIA